MASVNSFNDQKLRWLNYPAEVKSDSSDNNEETVGFGGNFEVTKNGSELRLFAPAKKDFWSKTFYTPLLIKSDAVALVCPVDIGIEVTIKVDFEYTPKSQFDQAGLLVYIDQNHWMKCGIEYCDGNPRLSVVVCNNFSDWSTQPWNGHSVSLKVHKVNQSDSLVVEAASLGSTDFQFVRIAHLSTKISANDSTQPSLPWQVGPYAACPIAQRGCEAVFSNFFIGPREASMHSESL